MDFAVYSQPQINEILFGVGENQGFLFYSFAICIHNMGRQEDIDGTFFFLPPSFLNGRWHASQQHLQTKDDKFPFISHQWHCVRCCTKSNLLLLGHRGFIPTAMWNSHKNNNSIASHSVRSIGRLKKTYLISLKLLVWNSDL